MINYVVCQFKHKSAKPTHDVKLHVGNSTTLTTWFDYLWVSYSILKHDQDLTVFFGFLFGKMLLCYRRKKINKPPWKAARWSADQPDSRSTSSTRTVLSWLLRRWNPRDRRYHSKMLILPSEAARWNMLLPLSSLTLQGLPVEQMQVSSWISWFGVLQRVTAATIALRCVAEVQPGM